MKAPIVEAYSTEDGKNAKMWCDYCQDWHTHGNENGHRVAHCGIPGSPFEGHGYELLIVGRWTSQIQRQHKPAEKSYYCPECKEIMSPKPPITCAFCGMTQKSTKVGAFSTWLYRQNRNVRRERCILAIDALADAFWPAYADTAEPYIYYLMKVDASDTHQAEIKLAWKDWLALEGDTQALYDFEQREDTYDWDWFDAYTKRAVARRTPARTREPIAPGLRFEILKRDEYRCQICGITAKEGGRLEVDHKEAHSKGGAETPNNLWTLCFDCNRGKRDKNL